MKRLLALAGCLVCLSSPLAKAEPVKLRLLAINDLHSQLVPPAAPLKLPDPADPAKSIAVRTGGIAHLASLLKRLRAPAGETLFVGTGDLLGNSPFHARLMHEEPTVEILNALGMAFSSVGNNEFYYGWRELLRLQNGGCDNNGCRAAERFEGARFQYLAASTVGEDGRPILPGSVVRNVGGIPVGFIGLTRRGSPDAAKPYNYAGIAFRDEVDTINAEVAALRARGVEAIVVLLHEGGNSNGDPNDCVGSIRELAPMFARIDKAVDLIVTGHTHQAYNCRFDGRLVTQAASQGRMLTAIDLELDPATRDVTASSAVNHLVETDKLPADPAVQAMVERYEGLAAPLARRVLATAPEPLTAVPDAAGGSALGALVADSMLAAVAEADIAFVPPQSLRAPGIGKDGAIRYEEVFDVLLRGRRLATMTLTGAQIVALLEQQWQGRDKPNILQVSRGFGYAWTKDGTTPLVADSLQLNGVPLRAQTDYRVVLDSALAEAGEGFSVLKAGRDKRYLEGTIDYELLARHLRSLETVAPPAPRIRVRG